MTGVPLAIASTAVRPHVLRLTRHNEDLCLFICLCHIFLIFPICQVCRVRFPQFVYHIPPLIPRNWTSGNARANLGRARHRLCFHYS
jgi:hypothetical protein